MSNTTVNVVAGLIFFGVILFVLGINLAWIYVVVKVAMYALGW